jgi:tetratricopeptide (TPR) repeat protein
MEALKKVQVTDDMKQGFESTLNAAEDALARGQFQDALDKYKQVMPFQPEPRVRAGMAWSLIGLDRQPMADNIWNVAAQEPAAVDGLGDALEKRGDHAGAQKLWARLKDTVPAYAPKLSGKLK